MKPIASYLSPELIQQIKQLEDLNHKVNLYLPENLKPHCKVGSFYQGCLSLFIIDSAWATELRYALPELRDKLRNHGGLYQLTNIKILSNPEYAELRSKKQKLGQKLSSSARINIEDVSKICSYEPLKEALLKLSQS